MSLEYKSSVRENITNIQTYIVDESQKSTKYFRVSDVPQVLQKGKNLLRITAHPTNLVPDTQIYVDVRDSNGNAIYYEIPDYLENDKSRVISIWIYHDKGDDNTPNGEATITLAGIANVDMDGNPLPQRHRGKLNVKWQTTVSVDRDRNNTSEIIFSPTITPTLIVSQSTEQYQNQPQSGDILSLTTQTGKVQYIFKGKTPIVEIKDSSTLNGEMVGGSIILNNFTKPAEPIVNIENPLSSTFFSSSIKEVLTNKVLKPITNFTTSFANRDDLTHTFGFVGEASYKIEYVQSGSNVSTQNKRNFVNIALDNIDPITGVVNKIKILHKSEGLPGDFELLNEVEVPFSSSVSIKVPIPSKNLKDPKILKLLYLNADGGISRTQTISNPFVFDGDNIYIGGEENLISGSIFISNTLGTGIEIGGASSGFMRSVGYRGITSASLGKAPGGFVIYSGSGNLVFGEDPLLGVGMQFVGDNDDRHLVFSTANGGILDVKTDKFFIGNLNQQYISGSDGNIEISSSIFHLDPKANGGAGSLVIGANATINADLTVDNLRTPASIGGQASTETNSSSSIKSDGFARFVSASIGGWGITTSSIEGGNLIMKPEGILQTRDFASGLKGWKISSEGNGTAEFENVRIRGTLRTTTFEKESVNAVGGQLWVANSTTITGSVTSGETTMSVKNASGFSAGEILLAKKVDNTGFQTEYILLESASVEGDNSNEDETYGRIYVQRAYGSGQQGDFVGDLASAAQSYEDGQVIVSTGKLNTGYIKMNANPNDTATPYMDIVERTGSGLYDVALKVRLGDLSGLANSDYVFGNSNPGFGLATDNVFLQGGIIAKTGSIGGIKMDDGKLFTGEGTYNNSNTGFYVDSGSNFSLGSKLAWNPTTEALTVRGSFQFADGTSVQTAIDNVSSGSVARTVELSADKYVVTFDESGNESPSNQTITLTATPQNFVGQVYYEYYKDSTIQGTRGTANTFTVDTTAEKPTSSTPKTYEVRAFTGSNGGTAVSTDSLTLFGLQPGSDGVAGTDAVTAFLTNESHTLPLSSSGVIQSYAGADTQIKVYEGITDKTSNYTFTESSPAYITATSSSNTFTITNSTTPYSGSVTITAVSESVSLSKIMSIGITRQGDDGSDGTPGANAKTITLTSDTQTFAFDDSTDTDATPTSAVFSINQQNLSGAIAGTDITITKVGSSGTINTPTVSGTTTNGTGTRTFTLPFSSLSKSDLPLTISVTKDGVTDSTSIIKIEGGANGVSALQYLLTNEAHIVPATSAGVVSDYSNSGTEIYVYEGTTELVYDGVGTSNGTWKVSTPTVSPSGKITAGSITDGGNYAVVGNHSSMNNGKDSVTISYPISGKTADGTNFSFTKTQTITKSKEGSDGTPGANAKTLSVTADSQIFTFSSASNTTVPEDNTIEFFFSQQNLSGTIGDSDIVVTDNQGGVITSNPTLSPSSLSGGSGVVSGSYVFATNLANDSAKFPNTVTVTKDGLTDSFKVFAISGGTDGVSSLQYLLGNEAHIVPASSAGVVSSYTNSGTSLYVYEGTTELDYDGVGTSNGTWKVSTPTVSPSGKITVGTLIDRGTYVDFDEHSSMDNSTDSVTISYPIIGKTTDGTSFSFTKTQTIAKSKEGSDGLPGTSASLISLTGDSQVFAFASASATTPDDTTIELFITQQNLGKTLTASDITIIDAIGGSHTVPTFKPTSLENNSGVISGSLVFSTNSPSPKGKYPITITATSGSLSDSFKVFALDGGSDGTSGEDAYTVFLTNESHTFPAAFNGDVDSSNLAAGATDVRIFKGTTQLTNDNNSPYGANTYRATSAVSGITMSSTKPGSDRRFTPTAVTNDSGTATITITDNTTGTAFTKTYTFSKSKEGAVGAEGSDSKTVALTAATNVITYNAAGNTPSPSSTITLTADSQNFTNGYFKFTGEGITDETSYTDGGSANQDTHVFGVPSNYFSTPKTIRVGVSEQAASSTELTFDTVTIVAVQPGSDGDAGADAVTAFLTSEADVIPAASDGTVSSFAGSGTTMKVYEGITDKSTGAGYTYTLVNTTTGLTAALSNNVLTISGLTPDSGSTDIRATSGSVTIDKTYSVAKSKAGPQGANNQDFSYLDASLTGIGPISSPGLLMNSEVFGFHNGIDGTNGSLSDFTSFLDDSGNFYLGGNSGGMSGSAATSGYLAWNNTDRSLLISGSNANIEVDKFFLGTEGSQFISGSNGNIRISGDVEFEGRNSNGATVYYDNFASYTNGSAVAPANSPQVDGSGVGYYNANAGEIATINTPSTVGGYSGKVLRLGNNGGTDQVYIAGNKLIPFNESSLYEVEFRYKIEIGSGTVYAGIVGYKSDGTTKVNNAGVDTLSSQHYLAVSGQGASVSGNGWVIRKGYFKGTSASGNGGQHNSDTDPGTLHSDVLNGYITPMFIGNYVNQGQVLLDYIKITEIGGGGSTKISGDAITTGVIKSNNLATDEGSEFRLDDGTFKLGGTDAAHTKLEWDGIDLSVKGNITVTNAGDFADPALINDFPDSSNLYAHYPLHGKVISNNGYDRILDFSGNERHGDDTADGLTYGTSFYSGSSAGPLPGAIRFMGYDGRVELHTLAQGLTNNMDISLSFWIKKTNISQGAVFGIHDGGANDVCFFVDHSNVANQVKLICGNDLGVINTGVEFTNTWRHIGLVMDNGVAGKLYIDGVFIGNFPTSTCNTGDFSNSDEMIFGGELDAANGAPTDDFNGYLSEFRIYDSVLSAANMQALYNLPTGIPSSTNISGDQISTGKLKSSNWSTTLGSNFDLDGGTFKLGGSSNPKLSWNGTTLAVKGNIQVEGGGFGSGAGELFGNPTGHLLDSDGRPGGWSAGYNNNDVTTIKSTDLLDGNGAIVELSSTTDADIGMVSHAFPIEVQQNYKIRLELKADQSDSNGLYIRIYEYDSELPSTKDSISHISTYAAANVQQSDRRKDNTWYEDDGVTTKTVENGPITTSYVSYNGTYTPTATAKYFSVVVLNWSGMSPTETKLFLKSMNVRKVSQGTTITGAGISTGLIQSVNLNADSGSRIDLDDGSMIMGGTASPGFEVTKEGFVTATNLTEKFVIVNSGNKSQYFENYSSNTKTRLILDGSLGGSVTMNLTIEEAPDYVISDIQFPSNVGSDAISDMELKIATDDPVTFDDNPSTGFFSGLKSLGTQLLSVALARS